MNCSSFELSCWDVPTTELPTVFESSTVCSAVSEVAQLLVAFDDASLVLVVSDECAEEVMGSGGKGDLVGWDGLPPKGGNMQSNRPLRNLP